MMRVALIVALLLCGLSVAEDKHRESIFSVDAFPVSYLGADKAGLVPQDDRVLIFAEGLDERRSHGILFSVPIDSLVAYKAYRIVEELDDGSFTVAMPAVYPEQIDIQDSDEVKHHFLKGKSGQHYHVEVYDGSIIPKKTLRVTIPGEPDEQEPPPPPPGDFDDFESLAQSLADQINEPDIRSELARVYSTIALRGEYEQALLTLDDARGEVTRKAGSKGTLDKNWHDEFRVPLKDAIKEAEAAGRFQDAKSVEAMARSIGRGLSAPPKAAVMSLSKSKPMAIPNGTIRMLSSDSCPPCLQWKRDVLPLLEAQGWKFEEVKTATGVTPRFVVCDNNICSSEISGYMSIERLIQELQRMKQ